MSAVDEAKAAFIAFIKAKAEWLELVREGEDEWVRMLAHHDKTAARIAKAKARLEEARQNYWKLLPP